ncbi:MAG TPA: GNAT family N-acetyltransferase [Methanomassiliicoccales archaeon]|nr:GNAT family N-acetyltransferase [Methanomassiliicoccales archaeon]
MQLRHYQNRDLADVWQVASESLRERYDPTIFTQLVPFWPDGLLVIEDLGRVVAFVFGIMSGPQQARVLMLAVDRGYRGAGLGTLLTQEFFRECGNKGIRQVSLEVRASNVGAQRFYQRLGFFAVRRVSGYYSDGEDGILLLRYL